MRATWENQKREQSGRQRCLAFLFALSFFASCGTSGDFELSQVAESEAEHELSQVDEEQNRVTPAAHPSQVDAPTHHKKLLGSATYPDWPETDLCAELREELREQAPLPGTPELDRHRAQILGRARSVPVVFTRAPTWEGELSPQLLELRQKMLSARDPTPVISSVLRSTRGDWETRRRFFLREAYLYADQPFLALRLSQYLRLDHLFSEPEIVIERGSSQLVAVKKRGTYWLKREGKPDEEARLFLFDRVYLPGEPPSARIHVDVEPLMAQLYASRIHWVQSVEGGHLVELEYGEPEQGTRTAAILREDETGQARLICESIPREQRESLAALREQAANRQDLIQPLLGAIDQMVEMALPFDEPKTEYGQQDGKLRIEFRRAYQRGENRYEFNEDEYPVFDGYGRPRLPQVCIDFITDVYDWATGGFWAPRGQKREQRRGAIYFPSFSIENPRSVEHVAQFAAAHPEWFDVEFVRGAERIPFRKRTEFFEYLEQTWFKYQIGDAIFINGLRSDEKYHYHSFFVVQRDPLTGIPILLAGNAGRAQMRTWEGEMASAPRRFLVSRVRLRSELLERAYEQASLRPGVPLELVSAQDSID